MLASTATISVRAPSVFTQSSSRRASSSVLIAEISASSDCSAAVAVNRRDQPGAATSRVRRSGFSQPRGVEHAGR